MTTVLGLGLGAVLDVTGAISFYYIFLPVWLFTIGVYTVLASRAGARSAGDPVTSPEPVVAVADSRDGLATGLQVVAVAALVVALVFAGSTMFGSPDMASYQANRDAFYRYGFICTLVYFATAYAAMRRGKATSTH